MDIKGSLVGPAGRLSNFTVRSFMFDGVPCSSIEGLLQSFKFDDFETQKEICKLTGKEAKTRGLERNEAWQSRQILWWRGCEYPRDSQAYQLLLDKVYETVFKNTDIREDLIATGDDVLTHSIGEQDPSKTVLTEKEFCIRLMKLRSNAKCSIFDPGY